MRASTSSAASAAEPPAGPSGEAARAEAGSFERIVGSERGAAYRRFIDWSVGEGFTLAVVEIRRPAQREALAEATGAVVPRLCIARLASVGARSIRTLLEEVCPSPAEVSMLMLTHLEESHDAGRICAELNVHRDELARRFAVPWVLVVHPAAALALQRDAPDFCDFAGLWLPEEPDEGAEPLLEQALHAPAASSGSTVRLSPDVTMTPKDLLSLAHEAVVLGHVDQAADLLAQYDMKHPDARTQDARRVHMDGLLLGIRGHLDEALTRFHAALELCHGDGDRPTIAALLEEIAHVRMTQGDFTAASHLAQQALELFEQLGDQRNRAASMSQLSTIELGLGNDEKALQLAREALKLSEELGDQVGRSRSLYNLSNIEKRNGNHAKARELVLESLRISDMLEDRNGQFVSLYHLATLAIHQGNYVEARERLREALELSEEMGNAMYRSAALHARATVEWREGNPAEARELWRESLKISEALGAKEIQAGALVSLGRLEAVQGRLKHGLALVREGVGIFKELGGSNLPEAREILRKLESLSAADVPG
ncbi:tetratricopeptide repeat protein [Sorangium sp. So ce1014]|uniref:tetratricopeptide repeat protein n=1 Tax=Sorangium sp. So ce1014 TaxID=3133326 RepID=UPI003F640D1C